jgi:hypothetical protein
MRCIGGGYLVSPLSLHRTHEGIERRGVDTFWNINMWTRTHFIFDDWHLLFFVCFESSFESTLSISTYSHIKVSVFLSMSRDRGEIMTRGQGNWTRDIPQDVVQVHQPISSANSTSHLTPPRPGEATYLSSQGLLISLLISDLKCLQHPLDPSRTKFLDWFIFIPPRPQIQWIFHTEM